MAQLRLKAVILLKKVKPGLPDFVWFGHQLALTKEPNILSHALNHTKPWIKRAIFRPILAPMAKVCLKWPICGQFSNLVRNLTEPLLKKLTKFEQKTVKAQTFQKKTAKELEP